MWRIFIRIALTHLIAASRYKIVVIMSIIQKLGQGIRMDFAKLCDIEKDSYSTHVIETPEFTAMGLVVGTYYEWTSINKKKIDGGILWRWAAKPQVDFELNRTKERFRQSFRNKSV